MTPGLSMMRGRAMMVRPVSKVRTATQVQTGEIVETQVERAGHQPADLRVGKEETAEIHRVRQVRTVLPRAVVAKVADKMVVLGRRARTGAPRHRRAPTGSTLR